MQCDTRLSRPLVLGIVIETELALLSLDHLILLEMVEHEKGSGMARSLSLTVSEELVQSSDGVDLFLLSNFRR
jgi:hypothetical protein